MKRRFAATFGLAFAAATLSPLAPAQADSAGPAIAAGIGGFALGAIAGGALAQPAPPPPPVVYTAPPRPVYVEPAPIYERCWFERRPVYDEYGDVIGSRRQRVCE